MRVRPNVDVVGAGGDQRGERFGRVRRRDAGHDPARSTRKDVLETVEEELLGGLLPGRSVVLVQEAGVDQPLNGGMRFGRADFQSVGEPEERPLAIRVGDSREQHEYVLSLHSAQSYIAIRDSQIANNECCRPLVAKPGL